jgi:dihydrofolate reductase
MLLGRVTYESFAGAFANAPADDPVASQMNRPAKVVVSRTLRDLEWKNSTLLTGDVVEQVTQLKERPGGDIMITGSISLVRTLLRAGLVDELSLLVHPIVVGKGQRLFEPAARAGALQNLQHRRDPPALPQGVIAPTTTPFGRARDAPCAAER